MLSPADAAVVRRETALPNLDLLLDPDRLLVALERTLSRPLAVPVITYLRYKPGRSCLAACRIEVDGEEVQFSAKHHRPDADKLRYVMERPAISGPLGPGRTVLAGTSVVVSVFPNDGKLRKLSWVGSSEAVDTWLRRLDGPSRARAQIHSLHYNPERRFVGRLTVGNRNRATVRCYRHEDYEVASEKAGRLRSQGPLRLSRPLLCDPLNDVIAMEWLPGRPLEESLTQVDVRADLPLVGAALAEIHRQDVPTLPSRTRESEAAAMLGLARDLAEICPNLESSARQLAMRLASRLSDNSQTSHPIHGDFYARQVLLDRDVVSVVDPDDVALGDRAIDIGRFRADLESAVIRGRLEADSVDAILELFLQGYQRTWGARPPRITLHAAAQLLRLTTHPFRRRERAWPERSAALLERAKTLLDMDIQETSARTVVPQSSVEPPVSPMARSRVRDPLGAAGDPSLPLLDAALDPQRMSDRLVAELRCFESVAHLEVVDIAVTRYKPGRRCLISYDVVAQDGEPPIRVALVAKVRARGPDHNTHQLLTELWNGAFGPRAADGIFVPEPLGVVSPLHMTVQRRVAGMPVARLLDGPQGRQLACRAAEAIDKLHRTSTPASRRHAIDDEMNILRRRIATVAAEHPRWRQRLDSLLEGCERLAARIEGGPPCGIHRDFHPGQLLADGDCMHLLDIDLYSEGDPALDVGNFVAHIDEYSLRRFGDSDRLADRKHVLIDRYLALSARTTREAIDAYSTLALTRHIAISRQFADRREHTAALLELCERRVLGCHAASVSPSH